MRSWIKYISFFLTFIGFQVSAQSKKIFTLKITLLEVTPYCGGAAPSDEMLQELSIPKPQSNSVIYYRKKKSKKIFQKKLDSNGMTTLKLSSGIYEFFYSSKINLTLPKKAITLKEKQYIECIQRYKSTPDQVVTLQKKNNLTWTEYKYCSYAAPCIPAEDIQYPPSAPPMELNK